MDFRRQTLAGSSTQASSNASPAVVVPLGGFAPQGNEFLQPPDSFASGQNVWVRNGSLEPRWRLSSQSISNIAQQGSNATNPTSSSSRAIGFAVFDSPLDVGSGGGRTLGPCWILGTTKSLNIGYFDDSTSQLSWYPVSSATTRLATWGSSATAFSWSTDANLRGAVVYSAPLNLNLLTVVAGSAPRNGPGDMISLAGGFRAVVAAGAIQTIPASVLSSSIKAIDLTNFSNRLVAWNCASVPQRCQWHVEGDPQDWAGLGSGSQDLTDMNGYGTRIFSLSDEMVLASTEEIWRGRYVGLPYVFSFSPITRRVGMPYERATLQTPRGIFWLGKNFTIYHMEDEAISELTLANPGLQSFLRERLKSPDVAFFTYSQALNQVRLWYSVATTAYPTESVTYDVDDKVWSHEVYGHYAVNGVSEPLIQASIATTTGGANWDWAAPANLGIFEAVVTSAGSFGVLMPSATSDMLVSVDDELTFGPTCAMPFRKETLAEVRYDFGARSASSVTCSWSSDFGKTTGVAQALSLTSESHSSQVITYPKYTAQNLSLKLQSTNGSWQLRRITTVTQDDGRAN